MITAMVIIVEILEVIKFNNGLTVQQYGISQPNLHQCSRTLADCFDCRDVIISEYVGNFGHKSNLT